MVTQATVSRGRNFGRNVPSEVALRSPPGAAAPAARAPGAARAPARRRALPHRHRLRRRRPLRARDDHRRARRPHLHRHGHPQRHRLPRRVRADRDPRGHPRADAGRPAAAASAAPGPGDLRRPARQRAAPPRRPPSTRPPSTSPSPKRSPPTSPSPRRSPPTSRSTRRSPPTSRPRSRTATSRSCAGRSPTPTATCLGYELVADGQGVKGTAGLLLDVFGDIGLERLAGRHPAWVRISPEFLLEVGTPPVRPDKVVLQLAAAPVTDEVLTALRRLQFSGYSLALDGLDDRLMPVCGILKLSINGPHRRRAARRWSRSRSSARCSCVATDVDTPDEVARATSLGFTAFQGDFFAKPDLTRRRRVGTGGIASLKAVAAVTAPDASFEDLEVAISSDVGLSLKLLRYVNSAFFALPRTVESVREALTLLGTATVRRWADRGRAGQRRRRRAGRARRARAPARPHVRGAGRQHARSTPPTATSRSACSRSPTRCSTRRWKRCWRRSRSATRSGGAPQPRRSEGRAAEHRGRVRARGVPQRRRQPAGRLRRRRGVGRRRRRRRRLSHCSAMFGSDAPLRPLPRTHVIVAPAGRASLYACRRQLRSASWPQ